jgi:short-subunit dehydrogenase
LEVVKTQRFDSQVALITGASTGIGRAYAHAFAARGASLILVARSADKLEAVATEARVRHSVTVNVIAHDLSTPGASTALLERVASLGRDVDILVNNAGFGTLGNFAEIEPTRLDAEMQLNCVTLVGLTRGVLPGMTARRRGTIVNVASVAAFQPMPTMAVYGATKAFVLSFSVAVAEEVRASGVRVFAVCPGATDTAFFDVAGAQDTRLTMSMRTVDHVIATTFRGLEAGSSSAVDGILNNISAYGARMSPIGLSAKIAGMLLARR